MEGPNPLELVKELVKKEGVRVDKGTEYCKRHTDTHTNCVGCESYEGCTAVCDIAMVMMYPIMYKPTSFEDFLKQETYVRDNIDKVLTRIRKV
jgi:hypothetical protein